MSNTEFLISVAILVVILMYLASFSNSKETFINGEWMQIVDTYKPKMLEAYTQVKAKITEKFLKV